MTKYAVFRKPSTPEDEGRHHHCGSFDTHADAYAYIEREANSYFPVGSYYISRQEDGKPGPSPMLTQSLRDSLALEDGQSPLAEASPESLDLLYDRINRKLAQGLVLDIHDGDIQAITADLRAQRLRWAQEQQRAEGKPRRRTPRSIADALGKTGAEEIEI